MQYPRNVLQSVWEYLKKAEDDLLHRKREIAAEDPYSDTTRFNRHASDDEEATEQFGHEQAQALSEQTEGALARVRAAMKRVDEGTYGKCVTCGKMIDTDRLGVDPTAELCMSCAKKVK